MSILLGVNVDHVATVRQARGTVYPDPIQAAFLAEEAGADSITIHLREDRRHIQERDLDLLLATVTTRVNLELAATPPMLELALTRRPPDVCLVPEKREELTTEGGLDVAAQVDSLRDVCERLRAAGIRVALFVDPDPAQLDASREVGAEVVELHTGTYAEQRAGRDRAAELDRIEKATHHAETLGLTVHAGHGLHYHNVQPIAAIHGIRELNIGHAIVARALMAGMRDAVARMKALMLGART